MGSSITYYFNPTDPGTYMYHCHQEATEHMQMGMLGNLWVHPLQDGTPKTYGGRTFNRFVYNDGDGSTGYDKEYPLQLGSMDHVFHELHIGIQPLPFAEMHDTYPMINGRGYPDTVNPDALDAPEENGGLQSQKISSLITINRATEGDKILLRMSDLNVTRFYTVTAMGLPMRVVGGGARIARGPDGKDLYFQTSSVTVGGGEGVDVIIDTAGVPAGTYFLYTTNLNYLSNFEEDFGGMMTEIVVL
jgi:FtsP/CotA-like multicopper oxidase with cupredoxin domain